MLEVKKKGKRWQKIVEIDSLYDLQGLDIEKAKEIMRDKEVVIELLPKLELGNLTLDNHHINRMMGIEYEIKKGKEISFPLIITSDELQEAKLNKTLIVKAMTSQESLIRYAEMIREEYESLDNIDLLGYDCIGNTRYARSRDECLRRKLIEREK